MNPYSCFNCDSLGGGIYKVHDEPTEWYIGLLPSGAAQYACASCRGSLYECRPLPAPPDET